MEKLDTKVEDSLDRLRTAGQKLHEAVSDAAGKSGKVAKADLETFSHNAKAVAESARSAIHGQNEATKKHLKEAATALEATHKHATEALKSSGQAFENSVQQTLASARASVQHLSEALAAKRSAETAKSHKK